MVEAATRFLAWFRLLCEDKDSRLTKLNGKGQQSVAAKDTTSNRATACSCPVPDLLPPNGLRVAARFSPRF